jgi:hypothetical protein
MELENCVKICSRGNIIPQAIEEPVDIDLTLPDYCPDIEKILKCSLTPEIFSQNISGGILELEGASIVTVMYVDNVRKTIRTSRQVVPFNRTINVKEYPENHFLKVNAVTEYINCRAISPRRLVIKGSFSIKAELATKLVNMVPSLNSFNNIQKLSVEKEYMDVTAVTEETFSVNETINVQNKPDIESIIKSIVKVNINEHKSIDDKIMVKGEVNLRLFYLSDLDNGETQCLDYVIPFTQVLSCTGADTSTINNISCNLLSWDIKTTKDKEEKLILLETRINLTAVCYKNKKHSFLIDAYSKNYLCDIKQKQIPLVISARNIKRNFIRKIEISSNDREFTKVLDTYNETNSVNATEENGNLTFKGKASLCVIALDKESMPFYIERTLDFTDKSDEMYGNVEDINAQVNSVSYRIKDEHTIELRAEITLNAFVTTGEVNSFVEEVVIYEDKKISKDSSSLTLYFAEENESIWDIAKHYNTDENYIREDNELEGEKLKSKEMLIIRR